MLIRKTQVHTLERIYDYSIDDAVITAEYGSVDAFKQQMADSDGVTPDMVTFIENQASPVVSQVEDRDNQHDVIWGYLVSFPATDSAV